MRIQYFQLLLAILLLFDFSVIAAADEQPIERIEFVKSIQPLLNAKCVRCHGKEKATQGLRLDVKSAAFEGGDSGPSIVPFESQKSLLVERIASQGADRMPPEGDRLSTADIDTIQKWIDQGAVWPDGVDSSQVIDKYDWWSLKPLAAVIEPGQIDDQLDNPSRSPIDLLIRSKLQERKLTASKEADRRTLARRLYFDLVGLPPTPEEVDAFVADPAPDAYERLVDLLLASPHYGERWARHWLDVVHYGDTHGYDKDKLRPNAWPYRDYVIRAMNSDKPYSQFVEEQIAGDVLASGTEDGITATGFIAAGPWDFIGHAEVPESKTDGKIARNLDRDDMVANTFNTFQSLTVQCARCHNHKFDPVAQEDYYRLQAVFASLDRADREYDIDPQIGSRRAELIAELKKLDLRRQQHEQQIAQLGGQALQQLKEELAAATKSAKNLPKEQFGFHSQISTSADVPKWVQVDLGREVAINAIQLVGCHDDFNQIGAGFGFPVRFKLEIGNDSGFESSIIVVHDATDRDFPNPGVSPLRFDVLRGKARYVRMTATKLAPRQNDFIFALAELRVIDESGVNVAAGKLVTAVDSIEAPPRWRQSNLVDGYYFGVQESDQSSQLQKQLDDLIERLTDDKLRTARNENGQQISAAKKSLEELPRPKQVYAGMVYSGQGTFTGTGASGGKPREIHILARGDVNQPGKLVGPGTVRLNKEASGIFSEADDGPEGTRRVALAKWITSAENPLTWRSIVNRVWSHHFGRGIVDSPNDFGRMGQLPSHPELLDWLAVEFRDRGQTLKQLHRQIVTSATYRQRSTAESLAGATLDSGNVYLSRMNRKKLDAEAIRDAVLVVAGKLNPEMGGPAFQDFVIEKPEHSPHYEYQLHDPSDVRIHRRSVYRFLVRSQPQPFMTTLDCADPSMSVDKRNETITALQALALLNNRLMLTLAKDMALRMEQQEPTLDGQITLACRLTLSRVPTSDERAELTSYAETHGLIGVCRVLMNLNEFVFVD